MLINDKVDAVYIPDSPSRIKATDYNQIKNEIQECITEAGLTPTKDVIQLPQALKILTAQSGAEEVAKIEAAGQEQLNLINTAGQQAVQSAQSAANTATSKAAEAASSASAAASSASAASGSASTASAQATNAADSAELAQKWATQTTAEVVSGQGYGAKYYADKAAHSAASIEGDAEAAAQSATEAAQSAQEAASSANLADIQNKITNCLTKIPQDINLELSNGTLTLKSGSKTYRGNGDVININSDISVTYNASATVLIVVNVSGNALQARPIENCFSGTSDPQTPNSIYYDTSANIVKFYPSSGGAGTEVSLPIAICTAAGQLSSIDQVFNGFGYIGNTLFALPGVEGLIPNGRTAEGALANTKVTVSAVRKLSFSTQAQSHFGLTVPDLFASASVLYNAADNTNYNPSTGNTLGFCNCGTVVTDSTGQITSFMPKYAFHAVDYYDILFFNKKNKDELIGFPNLSAKVSINSGYTAPSNGWVLIVSSNSSGNTEMKFDNQQVYFQGGQGSASSAACGFVPIRKGQVVTITGATNVKQFMPML